MNLVADRLTGPVLLLHPQIPKPLHLTNPRTILGDAWWNKARRATYARAEFRCEACRTHKQAALYFKRLEAHEVYDIDYAAGTVTFRHLVALCHACHSYIHQGRLRRLYLKHEITAEFYHGIIDRGDAILWKAGLNPENKNRVPDRVAPWGGWRMVIGSTRYAGRFATFEDWCRHFGEPAYEPPGFVMDFVAPVRDRSKTK